MDRQASDDHDLVIVGGNAGGLSVAISSLRSGLGRVRLVEAGHSVVFPELVSENDLDVGYREQLETIDLDGDRLVIVTNQRTYRARGCVVAHRESDPSWVPPIALPESDRVLIDELPDQLGSEDVLVVGRTDNAVELTVQAARGGANVVLAAGGMDPAKISPAGENMLRRLERERLATLLYRSVPAQIREVDGLPMAFFDDRRTPDLEFDHIVFASTRRQPASLRAGISEAAAASGRVVLFARPEEAPTMPTANGWNLGKVVAQSVFPELALVPERSEVVRRAGHRAAVDDLRDEHYNATITTFEPTHSDLWILRVRPDHGDTSHLPGQYASLGLGFWEPRIDDAVDADLDERWVKMIRRSYSISHPIFDANGYLARQNPDDELEFYIVLVPPTPDNVPALTPRLALKRPGDRIYLGPKVAGRYTLNALTDPGATVVFLSTGTGEAPHNAMITDLLQRGHVGPIISAVTVRQWADLGYIDRHRVLEQRYPNYHYLPLPTREPDVPKRYLQDLLRDGDIDIVAGGRLDPVRTHVYLCGNPSMIGLPEEVDGVAVFPEPTGVVELLVGRGLTLDSRTRPGNIHYEEYW
jgi:ferredoxin--NADP+ reductase